VPLRIVVAKPGLDGHDRGAKVVARALRDAGMEVVYTGLHQTPEQIVAGRAAGGRRRRRPLRALRRAHDAVRPGRRLLRETGPQDIVVFGGGIIPEADIPELERLGVRRIFTPGARCRRSSSGSARTSARPSTAAA
jgi:methylmalonyl-CoA mutase C-terminal domain/subunit